MGGYLQLEPLDADWGEIQGEGVVGWSSYLSRHTFIQYSSFSTPHTLPQWCPASWAQSSPNGIQASLEKVWASPRPAGWQREPTGCHSWSIENVALGASRLRNQSEAEQLGNTPRGWGLVGGHRGVRALGVAPWQGGMVSGVRLWRPGL